jgi:serine/threonine protein phosphatase PrpC
LVERGSTTAIVGSFHRGEETDPRRALLVIANVGDCGLIVVRPRNAGQVQGSTSSYDGGYSATATATSDRSYSSSYSGSDSFSWSNHGSRREGEGSRALVFKTEVRRYKGKMSKPHTLSAKTSYRSLLRKLDQAEVEVEVGDFIVVGSDGLWDNVSHEDVARCCLENQEKKPAAIAATLGNRAVTGYKRDDITVLVGRVVSDEGAEESKET